MQPSVTPKLDLKISCKSLKNADVLSKSDPQAIIFQQVKGSPKYDMIGSTEKLKNNLNPTFNTAVRCDYYFEEVQNIKVMIYDIDGEVKGDDHDFLGQALTTIGDIVSKPGSTITLDLVDKHGHKHGTVTITAEQIRSSQNSLRLTLSGRHLDKKDLFGKSDPYFVISKFSQQTGFTKVYESEVHKNTLDVDWKETMIPFDTLNSGDMMKEIQVEVFDWDSAGKHDLIGIFHTHTNELIYGPRREFELINPKKKEKSGYKNSGVVMVRLAVVYTEPSFLDYIVGGCEMNLVVAIDCTGSNGSPTSPNSLHYKHPTEPNEYAKAIVSIGNVLCPYDSDGMIPTYAFGASINRGPVSHCFPMGLTEDKLFARGVSGVLDTYYQNITSVDFSGPTYFESIIETTYKKYAATSAPGQQKYTILLIITDGEVMDMSCSISAVNRASKYPMSIVIVGVGKADFGSMETLDGDKTAIGSRDIVQFVPMRDVASRGPYAIAKETLKEIPHQMVSFFKSQGVMPNPPRVFAAPPAPPATTV
eukprot:gene13426-15821_t